MHAGFPGSQNPFPTRSPAYHKGTHPPPGPVATPWLLIGFTWSQGTLSARPFHLKPWLPSLGEIFPPPPPLPAAVQALHPASPSPLIARQSQAPQLHTHTHHPRPYLCLFPAVTTHMYSVTGALLTVWAAAGMLASLP